MGVAAMTVGFAKAKIVVGLGLDRLLAGAPFDLVGKRLATLAFLRWPCVG
jgi:hypothetical protein